MKSGAGAQPTISVVLTIVDGGDVLRSCLQALANQDVSQPMEVLVPYDYLCSEAGEMAAEFPGFVFIDISDVHGGHRPKDGLELHHFYDVRRSEALKRSNGGLIAIIEDRGLPATDWASQMIALHDQFPHEVIGGAVENGIDRLWNWATFFCDFGRYQPPLGQDQPEYVTDTNICYKRGVLDKVWHLWEESYIEAELHWAIARDGGRLMLTDRARTRQIRPPVSASSRASERYHWGRMFGQVRGRDSSTVGRLKYIVFSPLLPAVLYWRHLRRQITKGHHVGWFLAATPLTLYLLTCWSFGELMGYLQANRSS